MSVRFSSPLKQKPYLIDNFTNLSSPLFENVSKEPTPSDSEKEKLTYSFLSEIYKFDFMKSNVYNPKHFFALREQILEIEKKLITDKFLFDIEAIRKRIAWLITINNYEQKMSELGMILFYLDRDQSLPEVDSLTVFRSTEMIQEITSYLYRHATACNNPLIPSGKTHYIMRALSHMVFTSSQVYNRGGLISVKKILSHPDFQISKFLEQEHRDHILAIVNQILSSSSFDTLFKKKISVHPHLQEVIRLDLKLNPATKIESVHAFYDCIMALFFDTRQSITLNCYAVGFLIYGSENHTYKIMSRMIEWLETNCYIVDSVTSIPIHSLLEKKLYTQDLTNIRLLSTLAIELPVFRHISDLLSLKASIVEKKTVSLGYTLFALLKANKALHNLPFAKKLYATYKYNRLNDMQLAILELACMNFCFHSSLKPANSYYKKKLIDTCIESIERMMNISLPSQFQILLEIKLSEKLWLSNYSSLNVSFDEIAITESELNIQAFKGNVSALKLLLENSLRVFCLEQGKLFLLSSFTELQIAIKNAIHETSNALSLENICFTKLANDCILKIESQDFRKRISNYAANQIKTKGILGKYLNQADILVFPQVYGDLEIIQNMVYNISAYTEYIENSHSPYQFLFNLSKKLRSIDTRFFKTAPKAIICSTDHIWTVSPSCWQLLFNNKDNFYSFIQETVFKPAKEKLASYISVCLRDRIIKRFAPNALIAKEMKDFFISQAPLTHDKFRELLLKKVRKTHIPLIKQIIEDEFPKITLTKQELLQVLTQMKLKTTEVILTNIFNQLSRFLGKASHLASNLRILLIEANVAVINTYEIELALYKVKKLPIVIDVGDLNYTDDDREDPFHQHLIIAFSWVKKIPCYYIRTNEKQYKENNFAYRHLSIQYPTKFVNK